jgi:hypothetical protein
MQYLEGDGFVSLECEMHFSSSFHLRQNFSNKKPNALPHRVEFNHNILSLLLLL